MRRAAPAGVKLKKGEITKNIKKLLLFMRPYYIPVALSLIFTVGSTLLSIFAPQILSDLVNVITAGITSVPARPVDMGKLAHFAVILIIFFVSNAICTYVSGFIMTTISQSMC